MTDVTRKRIHTHLTRTRFLHLEDALDIAKIRLFVGEYRRGQGASTTAYHFLDLADARVLFSDLAWAKPTNFTDYKGTSNGGDGPQSRVLKINTKGDKTWLEIQNGPGQVIGQGAVKPAGKPTAAVSIPLTVWEARKLAHATLAYICAWEARHLLAKAPTAPKQAPPGGQAPHAVGGPVTANPSPPRRTSPLTPDSGDTPAAERPAAPALSKVEGTPTPSPPRREDGDSKPPVGATPRGRPPRGRPVVTETPAGEPRPVTTALPVATETGHQVSGAVTTSPPLGGTEGGCPATPTAFWTLYNDTAKPAGVLYPHAKNIATKHGGGGDWQTAIAKLHQATTQAQPTAS